jgi:hypothetical protein
MNYHVCLSEKQYSVAVQSLGESVFRKKKTKKIKRIIVLSTEINKKNNWKACQQYSIVKCRAGMPFGIISTLFWAVEGCSSFEHAGTL